MFSSKKPFITTGSNQGEIKKRKGSLAYVKLIMNIAVSIAIVAELVFFPTFDNLLGCIMTVICWALFSHYGLSLNLIIDHIFSWLIFFSMSMYRILPLFATLIEGKPISYKFEMATWTFIGETLLYCLSLLSFLLAIRRKRYNTKLHIYLNKTDYYDSASERVLWMIGIIGVFSQVYVLLSNVIIGDIFGKFVSAFLFFQSAPILIFFPSLYKRNCSISFKNNIYVWFYIALIIVLSIPTNSRSEIMGYFGTFALLFLLAYLRNYNSNIIKLSPRIIILGVGVFLSSSFLSDISLSLLSVRGMRSTMSSTELLQTTIRTYMDKEKMSQLRANKNSFVESVNNYREGWTEEYVDNFALNRYCNIRITDATLYYQQRLGFGNEKMLENYKESVVKLLPSPILDVLGINVQKSNIYSFGDYLYAVANNRPIMASMRVTSHLADGLATFGFFYFPIQFVLFYLCFLAVDCFSVKTVKGVQYSTFGLITIFSYLAMFRNANGCFGELSYLLRSFPQFLLVTWIGMKITRFISRS